MILLPLLLAPLVMAAAGLVERRLGSAASGWTGALPVAFAVAVLAVAVDAGPRTAAAMALSAAAHVPAQVAFGLAFAYVLRRRGLLIGAACGVAAYLAGALVVPRAPAALDVAVAVVALTLAPRLMPTVPPRPGPARRRSTTALTCLGASVVVAVAVLSSRLAGPALAGAIAAFPMMCTMLTVVTVRRDGPSAGVQSLGGLVRSLPCYLVFGVTVALAAPLGGPLAVGLGLLTCAATAALTFRPILIAARPLLPTATAPCPDRPQPTPATLSRRRSRSDKRSPGAVAANAREVSPIAQQTP